MATKTEYEKEIEREIEHDAAPHKKRKAGGNARGSSSKHRMDRHARRQVGGVSPATLPMQGMAQPRPMRPGTGGVAAGMPGAMPGAVMPTRVQPRPVATAAPAVLGAGTTPRGFRSGGRARAEKQMYPTKWVSPLGDEDTKDRNRSRGDFSDEKTVPRDDYKEGGWIRGAIKNPGRETRAAKREGVSTHEYMEEHKDSPGSSGKAARLGLRLSAMNK